MRAVNRAVWLPLFISLSVVLACGDSPEGEGTGDPPKVFFCGNPDPHTMSFGCDGPLPTVPVMVTDLCLPGAFGGTSDLYSVENVQASGMLKPVNSNSSNLSLTATITLSAERIYSRFPENTSIDCFGALWISFQREDGREVGPDTCEEAVSTSRVCRCTGRHIIRLEDVPVRREVGPWGDGYRIESDSVSQSSLAGCFDSRDGTFREGYLSADVIDNPFVRGFTDYIIFGPSTESAP